jgi:hypothetical protein
MALSKNLQPGKSKPEDAWPHALEKKQTAKALSYPPFSS